MERKKPQRKARPVRGWGFKTKRGHLVNEAVRSKRDAVDSKFDDEVVRVEIREV